jgi:hypothetical protein
MAQLHLDMSGIANHQSNEPLRLSFAVASKYPKAQRSQNILQHQLSFAVASRYPKASALGLSIIRN